MPTYSRETVSEAVGSALDTFFGGVDDPTELRSIAVEFSDDGSRIIVCNVVSLEDNEAEVVSHEEFAHAFLNHGQKKATVD